MVAEAVVAGVAVEMVEKEKLRLEKGALQKKEGSLENFLCEKEFVDFAGIKSKI